MTPSFFSYRKGNSFFHKISPHIKLWLELLFCIFVFLPDEWFFCDIYSTISSSTGDGPKQYLAIGKSVLSQIPIIKFAISFKIYLVAFCLSGRKFAIKSLAYILLLGVIALFGNGIIFAINYTLKFLFTAFLSQIIFATTSSLQMKNALEEGQNFIAKIFPPIKKANPALAVFLAISFIPQIFATWDKVKLAAKARSSGSTVCDKRAFNRNFLRSWAAQFSALFSCLLFAAETKRKALVSRSALD